MAFDRTERQRQSFSNLLLRGQPSFTLMQQEQDAVARVKCLRGEKKLLPHCHYTFPIELFSVGMRRLSKRLTP